jgi:hypothetical protein
MASNGLSLFVRHDRGEERAVPRRAARYRAAMRIVPRLAVACLALVGCSSWKLSKSPETALGPESAPPPGAAKVCVIRTAVVAIAVTFPTRDNGALVGATSGPTYFCYAAEPGEHEIVVEADEVEVARLTAEPGKSYFLEQRVDFIFGYVKCRSVWVAESEAARLFRGSYPGVLVEVPGSEKLPPDRPYARAKRSPG